MQISVNFFNLHILHKDLEIFQFAEIHLFDKSSSQIKTASKIEIHSSGGLYKSRKCMLFLNLDKLLFNCA